MSKSVGTILITGGTSGLGYACAVELARRKPNHEIILASRTNTNDASGRIKRLLTQQNVSFLPLDLSSLAKVREFAKEYSTKAYPPISALLLNAASQYPKGLIFTDDGIEKTFAVNHVGHALLFYLLRPYLAPNVRIIITTSGTHDPEEKTGMPDAEYVSAEEMAHPPPSSREEPGRKRYTNSKLCNVLWTYALHDHIANSKPTKQWTITTYCPGLIPGTQLAREAGPFARFGWHHILPHIIWFLRIVFSPRIFKVQETAASLAKLAIDPRFEGVSGKYFHTHEIEVKSSKASYDKDKQLDLWLWTAKFVAMDDEEAQAFENLE